MSGAVPPLPNTPSWRGAQLKHRDRDNFTFTFIYNATPVLLYLKLEVMDTAHVSACVCVTSHSVLIFNLIERFS
jgi:hypothetical protein